jgi:hypothetical protein
VESLNFKPQLEAILAIQFGVVRSNAPTAPNTSGQLIYNTNKEKFKQSILIGSIYP